LPSLRHEEPLGLVAGVDRDVRAEAERVELVHPGVVAPLAAPPAGDVAELREGLGVERPPLGTVLAGGGGAVQRAAALAPVEARQVPAGQRGPVHAVPVHVAAARGEALHRLAVPHRELEHLGERGLRRVRARRQPDDRAGESERRSPHRTVGRRRERVDASVLAGRQPLVLRRIRRSVGLHVLVAAAVPVRVPDQRGPPLRPLLVARRSHSLVLNHPTTGPPPLIQRVRSASSANIRWCVPKQVPTCLISFVSGRRPPGGGPPR
jgi:hypothetical protein